MRWSFRPVSFGVASLALILGGCVAPTPARVVLQQSNYFRPGCDPGYTKRAQFMNNGALVDVVQDPCAEPSAELRAFLRAKGLHGESLMRAGRHIARKGYPRWQAGYEVWRILQQPTRSKIRCTKTSSGVFECEHAS
jgi:hypothetical protein